MGVIALHASLLITGFTIRGNKYVIPVSVDVSLIMRITREASFELIVEKRERG